MGDDVGMYKYEEMSSKVLRSDKRLLDDKSSAEHVDTNPQSIKGKISSNDFGSRVTYDRSQNEAEDAKKEVEDYEKRQLQQRHKSKRKPKHDKTLLDTKIQGLDYIPTTESNLHVYTQILSWCSSQLDNDVPGEVINSLADIIIEILKSDETNNLAKKKDIENTINIPLSDSSFIQVYDLVKEISDYTEKKDDDSNGVGIVFESEDEEDAEGSTTSDDDDNKNPSDSEPDEITLVNQEIIDDNDIVDLINSKEPKQYLDIKAINRFWIAGKLQQNNPNLDSIKQEHLIDVIIKGLEDLLNKNIQIKDLEETFSNIIELENGDLFTLLMKNYSKVHYGIKLSEAKTEEQLNVLFEEMAKRGLISLVNEYKGKRERDSDENEDTDEGVKKQKILRDSISIDMDHPKYININNLKFTQGSRLMTTSTFQLPDGSFKRTRHSWEEIHIPPPNKAPLGADERLVQISELPKWAQDAFPAGETQTLNRIQSKVYPAAFNGDGNILMCAPTGAGKTNVAMLTILRTLSKFKNSTSSFKLNNFKIVFIAPLKALVQEQVREFDRRLSKYGITVNELTGDSNLTKHQIANTQILVTTPEKWDVITRKNNDASYVQLVDLIIIDEIHLLHDERGPVLESIVARAIQNEKKTNGNHVRFVGLSATLPNYKDVAQFLNVDQNKNLFYFDSTYRPCPLAQQFIGITEKKAFKKYEAMNEVCYEKVTENINNGHQVIIFVHSRKETEKTAKWIADKILENDHLKDLMSFSTGVKEILRSESENAKNKGLKQTLQMGIGIHHAGMTKEDRATSEDLFAEGHIKVLVSTATLAWGVNLPAHTVIIKGTSVYSPEKGTWVDLSPQDVLQMLGRAGRPRYDTHGEGIIITDQNEVKYYLAILNQQLPIESQMYSQLADSINAEIVSGSISSLEDCINWMGYTYLHVRMLNSRSMYNVGPEYDNDPQLIRRRKDLAYSALVTLAKNGLVKYNYKKDSIMSTNLGKVASYYYISYSSIKNYDEQLKPYFNEIELFRIFASSEEFRYIPVRREEKNELQKLMETAPIPVNESVDDPLAKISVLLQAYISRLKLDGFALMADMIYVIQSAGRLFRAMYDLVLKKKWSRLALKLLSISKMIERRLWLTSSPLRQFPDVPQDIIQVTERSITPWKYYLALDEPRLAIQALKAARYGNLGWQILQKFPQLGVTYAMQPITPSLMRIQLEVTPNWDWDVNVHGYSESFTLVVEDCDAEKVLYNDHLIINKDYIGEVHNLDFTVPIFEIEQPNYFVSCVSDKWLHCETRVPLMLTKMKIPTKFPAPTLLNDSLLVQTSELGISEFQNVFQFKEFNKFQSDAFETVYNTTKNVMFHTAKGNGKTTVAELALLNHWKNEKGRAVYISPTQEIIDTLLKKWKKKFGKLAGGKVISKLSGELNEDLIFIAQSHLTLCTPEQFDLVSRRWQQRKNIQSIELVIADDTHLIGDGKLGTIYEIVLSRMRFIDTNLEKGIRFVSLGSSIASYKDFADWLNIPKHSIFNFDSRERNYPVSVQFQMFDIEHNASLIKCCIRPAYDSINSMNESLGEEKATIFVPSRKHCVDITAEFIKMLKNDDRTWLKAELSSLETYLSVLKDSTLAESLKYGIGFYYKNMHPSDKSLIEKLFEAGALTCLLASLETASYCPSTNFVIVLSTQTYSKSHRYTDYKINDLLEMIGTSRLGNNNVAKALILTNSSKIDYYKKFLSMSLPIESHMNFYAHDLFLTQINSKLVKNRQDAVDILTYTLFYRRLYLNPSFYGVNDTSEDGLSEFLSELVENTLQDLSNAKLVELNFNDEEEAESGENEDPIEIIPGNGCIIAAHHNVSFVTLQTLMQSLNSKTRLKKLLEIVSNADEFEDVPIRQNEESILLLIYNNIPIKWASDDLNFESPNLKTFILLQAYFSRLHLNVDLKSDLKFILSKISGILSSCVDILSSEGNLNAMSVMDLSQMCIQGMWSTESPLKQLPFFSDAMIEKCSQKNIKSVYDFMEAEDDTRENLLNDLSESEVSKVADFVNKYPNLDMNYHLHGPIIAGQVTDITIEIERDEDVDDSLVLSTQYPLKKHEGWWVVLGDPDKKILYAIKKVELLRETQSLKMKFTIGKAGDHNLCVWCISDSFCDADKQVLLGNVKVENAAN